MALCPDRQVAEVSSRRKDFCTAMSTCRVVEVPDAAFNLPRRVVELYLCFCIDMDVSQVKLLRC
jgi:hypothetical protein